MPAVDQDSGAEHAGHVSIILRQTNPADQTLM
jgi:hypothetical protein